MKRLSISTWIAIAGVIVLVLIVLDAYPKALLNMLSVPLVLVLPGLLLTLLLFPRNSLGLPERLLLSVGLSVTFIALSGLLLAWTPWGLQAKTLWIALLVSLAVGGTILFLRRRREPGEKISFQSFNFNARQWILMVLAAIVTVMAVRVASTPTPQPGLQGYTMLWVRPAEIANTVRVGVESEEFQTTRYQLKYEFNDTVREGAVIRLEPGESWQRDIYVPVDKLAGKSFTVLLYRLDEPENVYRRVVWWPENQ